MTHPVLVMCSSNQMLPKRLCVLTFFYFQCTVSTKGHGRDFYPLLMLPCNTFARTPPTLTDMEQEKEPKDPDDDP